MTDERAGENDSVITVSPDPAAPPADVALVLPAEVCATIATDEAPLPSRADASDVRALDSFGESIHRKLDALQTLFEREIRAEATREKVVDRLHAELQEYKQDLLLNILRPVFVDLIQLHDDIGKIVGAQTDESEGVRRLLGLMAGFQQGIEDILYRQGVEPYALEGDAFDPRRQRAVATVPTDHPALNKTIAARHRKGFHLFAGEKMIRPEIVSVYALRKPAEGLA